MTIPIAFFPMYPQLLFLWPHEASKLCNLALHVGVRR